MLVLCLRREGKSYARFLRQLPAALLLINLSPKPHRYDGSMKSAGASAVDLFHYNLPSVHRFCQANFFCTHSMITIVQRVLEAKVTVHGEVVGAIPHGLLALAAVVK